VNPKPPSVPRRITASTPTTPIASVSTTTWPGAGTGAGTSITAMPLGSPNRLIATARTIVSVSSVTPCGTVWPTVTDVCVHFHEVRTMTDRLPQMLRADAQDNRDRVLEAARSLFSEQGFDVTMREIARRAKVGPATLYRRFPTKQMLVAEAFEGELRSCRGIVDDGCADPDPWRGFCSVIERLSVLNVRSQGFVDAFMSANPEGDTFVEHRTSLLRKLAELARRAQAAGGLRSDFVIDDLVLVLLAGRGLSSTHPSRREAAGRRLAALAIDAFRRTDANAVLPRAPRLAGRPT
jgi:AcrR family transcriptional regulator